MSLEGIARVLSQHPQLKGYKVWVERPLAAPCGVDDNGAGLPQEGAPPLDATCIPQCINSLGANGGQPLPTQALRNRRLRARQSA